MGGRKRELTDAEIIDQPPSASPTKKARLEASADTTPPSSNPKIHACTFDGCDKAFDRRSKLEIHIRCHTNERPFVCREPGCDKDFQRNEHLTRHLKDKHGIGHVQEFRCTYKITSDHGEEVECGKVLPTASKLRRHVDMHKDKEPLKCQEPGCGKFFRKMETLQRHIKQDHRGENAFQCTNGVMGPNGERPCGESFGTVSQLKSHQSRIHGGYRFFCDICVVPDCMLADFETDGMDGVTENVQYLGFSSYAEFQNHMKIEHPPSCPECGVQCESTRALRAHQDIVHTTAPERQKFKCTWPDCDRGFTKKGNLDVHIQSVHTKARDFVCGTFDLRGSPKVAGWNGMGCGRALTTKASLEEHVRTQHMGLPSKLKKTIKSEDGDTPSSMMDLDEVSTPHNHRAADRALGLLTGFGYEESRPIACLVPNCQFRFVREYDLVQHVELSHGWHIDDVNDAVAEREALSGDKFWIGGAEEGSAPLNSAVARSAISVEQEQLLRTQVHMLVDHEMPRLPEKLVDGPIEGGPDMMLDPALDDS